MSKNAKEKLRLVREMVDALNHYNVLHYTMATLPKFARKGEKDWGEAHIGRSRSAVHQLGRLEEKIDKIRELLSDET